MRKEIFLLAGLAALALLSGCVSDEFNFNSGALNFKTCSDGTPYRMCSFNSPYYCKDGNLVKDEKKCGAITVDYNFPTSDYNFPASPGFEPAKKCTDGTLEGYCSASKPMLCQNEQLVKKASLCGCPAGTQINAEDCKVVSGEKVNGEFEYTLKGVDGRISLELDTGLRDYLAGISRTYYCTPECPTETQLQVRYLDEEKQKPELDKLAKAIQEKTSNKDEQARLATSLAQKIPYDFEGFNTNQGIDSYPYEVLVDYKGVCGEKSRLLAFLLKEFGFGVALFKFERENHMSVGIKCPMQYSYKNTGYCFAESTSPNIITNGDGNYLGAGKLTSSPKVLIASDGISMDSVGEDFEDNKRYQQLSESKDSNSSKEWFALRKKYGLSVKNCEPGENYCNGACFGACGASSIFKCSLEIGGFCKLDPANCPQGFTACNDDCWPACTEGIFKCKNYGGVCEITAYS